MKKSTLIFVSILAFTIGILVFNYFDSINHLFEKTLKLKDVQSLSAADISTLEIGKTVRIRAILVKHIGTNCIELFDPYEYNKYNGDPLWAATSKFAIEPRFNWLNWWRKDVIVTGKMTRVTDSKDTGKTCNLVTGNIFEITKIEE